MKNLRKIITFALSLSLISSTAVFASTEESIAMLNSIESQRESQIQELLDERLKVLVEDLENEYEIKTIDEQLENLGVEFLDVKEVKKNFPETKNNKELSLKGQTLVKDPYAVAPTSENNYWMSYRTSNVSYNGTKYNIQRLVAQPRYDESPLIDNSAKSVVYGNQWGAATQNLIKSVATTTVGALPGASYVLGLYDGVKSFISGINGSTLIKSPKILYNWNAYTTCVFTYVKKEGQSDNYQWLSLISTKNENEITSIMNGTQWKNSSGIWTTHPNTILNTKRVYSTPTEYDNNTVALKAYASGTSGAIHRANSSIKITGPEGKTVHTLYPVVPQFPLHCE